MPAHFENVKKRDGSKILAGVHTLLFSNVLERDYFQKLAVKNLLFACERKPLRHICSHFQIVLTSCERSLESEFHL